MSIEFSLCIPTMRRWSFLQTNLPRYLSNKYIKEIIICDETGEDYDILMTHYSENPKIKLFKNEQRLGPFLNKLSCMEKATYNWICLMDSDNFADIDYFDALQTFTNGDLSSNIVYCPSFAKPTFNYTSNQNILISKSNIQTILKSKHKQTLEVSFNTGNYCIHKKNVDIIKTLLQNDASFINIATTYFPCDVIFMNYLLLIQNVVFILVPHMHYEHVVHDGSIYSTTCNQFSTLINVVHRLFNNIGIVSYVNNTINIQSDTITHDTSLIPDVPKNKGLRQGVQWKY